MIKVGLELFVEAGPKAISLGEEVGLPVFLDLKLHDIPETVERAVARAAQLGARIVTVHASGGPAMLARAVKRAEREATGLQVTAVTVLTSLDKADLAAVGVGGDVGPHVQKLAIMAYAQGVRSFVCSPHEIEILRETLPNDAVLITPGVRPAGAAGTDDQKRVMSAGDAIRKGATGWS
jgi:orotidine-5'-phosphate decarboxylase